jgi:hypothetical protein
MLKNVPLCRSMTEIRDFQDGQDSGILTDAVPADLISQPLAYGPATYLGKGDSAARGGQGVYGLRP